MFALKQSIAAVGGANELAISLLRAEAQKDEEEAERNQGEEEEEEAGSPENQRLLRAERADRKALARNEGANSFLYPSLNDKDFVVKIAQKSEFRETQYDGTVRRDIEQYADELAKAPYELQPHQAFVKNFMSVDTPYNSLLLFHGLGSGKTCSAIGVCEEMRAYLAHMGLPAQRILIVASENVQDNFRSQLFDERKLKQESRTGEWYMENNCVGNALLQEVLQGTAGGGEGIKREKVIQLVQSLINKSYTFMGYIRFANRVLQTLQQSLRGKKRAKKSLRLSADMVHALQQEFDGTLLVIDEVHNIRKSDEKENKKVAYALETLVKHTNHMRLLLLSATPMYNSYREIVWLLNLLNSNDKRGIVRVSDIFTPQGHFTEQGKDLLIRKATGYISFVRGENPYTFPFRVYPKQFAPRDTFPHIPYPKYQLNLLKIRHEDKKRILSLFLTPMHACTKNICGACQGCLYALMMQQLRHKMISADTKEKVMRREQGEEEEEEDRPEEEETGEDLIGYTVLQYPLQAQIIAYPMLLSGDRRNQKVSPVYLDEWAKSLRSTQVEEEEEQEEEGASSSAKNVLAAEDEEMLEKVEDKEYEGTAIQHEPLLVKLAVGSKRPASKRAEAEEEAALSEGEQSAVTKKKKQRKQLGGQPEMLFDYAAVTGRDGLQRMMDTDGGRFVYRPTTLETFGRIFQRDRIGNYSAKIKRVLDALVDPATKRVSDGILLVYSNFLDAGLIPMALALEEAGLVRYGGADKSLFADRREMPIASATTMQPVKRGEPMAAYALITGEPKLSPDNEAEVKAATDKANKTGEKIKVILISRAGSEGIDFKFIRQVHILDPWYNLNRIEQIVGRAVRNFSHVDLPFPQRNVEIYMHASLTENNVEESADLYMYRVAESKAMQIGQITRILKQTAVDCVLHHAQTNFTQAHMKLKVDIQVSTGQRIKDFAVGDAPFSPSCDYMEKCHYDCDPNSTAALGTSVAATTDTFSEQFVSRNVDRITQRIRLLFRQAFFYKKSVLLQLLRMPTPYPETQLYYALTRLADPHSEHIIYDKYGRTGRLVNIGEYYLFQPAELRDPHASLFERSVPPQEKPMFAPLQLQPAAQLDAEEGRVQQPQDSALLGQLEQQFDALLGAMEEETATKGTAEEEGEASALLNGLRALRLNVPSFDPAKLLAQHLVDQVPLANKTELVGTLLTQTATGRDAHSFLFLAKQYFISQLQHATNEYGEELSYWISADPRGQPRFFLLSSGSWSPAEASDSKFLETLWSNQIKAQWDSALHPLVGFYGLDKTGQEMVFKTKVVRAERDTGARCDEADKKKVVKQMAQILSGAEDSELLQNVLRALQVPAGTSFAELESGSSGKIVKVNKRELCAVQEFVLRHLDATRALGQRWFVTPEEALLAGFFLRRR